MSGYKKGLRRQIWSKAVLRMARQTLGNMNSNLARDIGERTLSIVQKKLWRLRIPMIPADVADRFVDVPVDGQQVQIAVQIGIEEDVQWSFVGL